MAFLRLLPRDCVSKRFFSVVDPARNVYYSRPKTSNIESALQKCSDLKSQVPEWCHTDPSFQNKLRDRMKYEWTYQTNALEGNSLSAKENLFFLREGITVGGKPFKDLLEAKNHHAIVEILLQEIEQDDESNGNEFSEYTIRMINGLLLQGIEATPAMNLSGKMTTKRVTAGEYKLLPNSVMKSDATFHDYVDPIQVGPQMTELVDWINANFQEQDPVLTASIAHYNMVRIHPFDDGNGRGARILMNLIMIKGGYPCAIIKVQEKPKYLDALQKADGGDMEPFICFIAESVCQEFNVILQEVESFKQANPDYCKSKNYD